MTQKRITTIACLFIFLNSFSQAGMPEFGKISAAELASKECPFAKDVPAYYLVNYAKTEFNYPGVNFDITVKRRIRIKILNEKGYTYATVTIPHLGNKHSSTITDIEAFIYTPDENGAILKTRVEKKDIYKINLSKTDDANLVKFTFPGLKPGCIIEYRYEHTEKNSSTLDPWLLQNSIPVALSYCEINYPKSQIIEYRLAGKLPVNENNYKEWPIDSGRLSLKKVFLMKDIPAFTIEPMMSSAIDNLKRIEFSLTPDPGFETPLAKTTAEKWQLINEWVHASVRYGLQSEVTIPGTEKLLDSVKQLHSKKEKINAVYQYVRNQVAWNKHQTVYPGNVYQLWSTKTGNSAGINTIILNLLKKLDIECYPVLLSTRENGKTDMEFANLSQFNGMDVVAIDSIDYYVLDGSSRHSSCFIPPLNVVNRDVFLAADNGYKWVNVNEGRPLIKDSVFIKATLDKDGLLKGETVTSSFHFSRDLRLQEEKEAGKSANDLLSNDIAELITDSAWTVNKEIDSLPLAAHKKFHYTLNNTNNFYFLNAFLFNSFRKNPFKDSARTADIDFMCNQQFSQVINITLAPEIVMETVPGSIIIRMADSSMIYSRKAVQRGQVLWVENNFTVARSVYTPDEYPALWQFFQKVYALLSEEIVLNKKT